MTRFNTFIEIYLMCFAVHKEGEIFRVLIYLSDRVKKLKLFIKNCLNFVNVS